MGETKAATKAARVHWSHTQSLAEQNPHAAGSMDTMPVNLADGQYDEHAERRAFLDAVMEWRGEGGSGGGGKAKVPIVRADGSSLRAPAASNTAGPPAAASPPPAAASGGWVNPFGPPADSEAGKATPATPEQPSTGGGALLHGPILDEEAEHRAFRAAVASWRTGGGGGGKGAAETASAGQQAEARKDIKFSCYQCLKLCYAESAMSDPADSTKRFCGPGCRARYQKASEARAERISQLEAERGQQGSDAPGRGDIGVEDLDRVPGGKAEEEERESLAHSAVHARDIWDLDIPF